MKQAYEMTVEALGLALVNRKEEKEEIPDPSDLDKIQNEDGTIVIAELICWNIKGSTIQKR